MRKDCSSRRSATTIRSSSWSRKRSTASVKSEFRTGPYEVPLGKAALAREGKHVYVITYGAMVPVALEAADEMKKEGVEVEVLDLRTLQPYDTEAILQTVGKTGHVVLCKRRRASAAIWARSPRSSPKKRSSTSRGRSSASRVGYAVPVRAREGVYAQRTTRDPRDQENDLSSNVGGDWKIAPSEGDWKSPQHS